MRLRPYQQASIDAMHEHLARAVADVMLGNPLIVIPTGGGKTPVIARICEQVAGEWQGRVLVLAHVKELLEQAASKIKRMAPQLPVGIYSSGLKRKDLGYAVTVAGIQSIYKRACDLGHIDLVIIDECHLIPPKGDGMYRQFLTELKAICPNLCIVGLTATPYRLGHGMIAQPEHFVNTVCYEVGVRELIADGYLCKLRSKSGKSKPNLNNVRQRGGEFVAEDLQPLMMGRAIVTAAVDEIVAQTTDRHSVLIFTVGKEHGEQVCGLFKERHGIDCAWVDGDSDDLHRDRVLAEFKAGKIKYLANINVLTTGFDAPDIDCVAMLRPTMSPGLYYQMVGRGFRLPERQPGKQDCLVLDFSENVMRHGPVDMLSERIAQLERKESAGLAPCKVCPVCFEIIGIGYATCPQCEHVFPVREEPVRQLHHESAVARAVISTEEPEPETIPVSEVAYFVHTKRDNPEGPKSMKVSYRVGFQRWIEEWICVEHPPGFARRKAEGWWAQRCNEAFPMSAEEAVDLARDGAISKPITITVKYKADSKFPEIIKYQLTPMNPDYSKSEVPDFDLPAHGEPAMAFNNIDDDEIPF